MCHVVFLWKRLLVLCTPIVSYPVAPLPRFTGKDATGLVDVIAEYFLDRLFVITAVCGRLEDRHLTSVIGRVVSLLYDRQGTGRLDC